MSTTKIHVSVTLDTGAVMGTSFSIPSTDSAESAARVWASFIGWPVRSIRLNGGEIPLHSA